MNLSPMLTVIYIHHNPLNPNPKETTVVTFTMRPPSGRHHHPPLTPVPINRRQQRPPDICHPLSSPPLSSQRLSRRHGPLVVAVQPATRAISNHLLLFHFYLRLFQQPVEPHHSSLSSSAAAQSPMSPFHL